MDAGRLIDYRSPRRMTPARRADAPSRNSSSSGAGLAAIAGCRGRRVDALSSKVSITGAYVDPGSQRDQSTPAQYCPCAYHRTRCVPRGLPQSMDGPARGRRPPARRQPGHLRRGGQADLRTRDAVRSRAIPVGRAVPLSRRCAPLGVPPGHRPGFGRPGTRRARRAGVARGDRAARHDVRGPGSARRGARDDRSARLGVPGHRSIRGGRGARARGAGHAQRLVPARGGRDDDARRGDRRRAVDCGYGLFLLHGR